MSTDNLREKLADTIRAAEPYIYADPADASELADALLPIIDAHVAEVREQIAARLDECRDTAYGLSKTAKDETIAQRHYARSCAYGQAARIARGQAHEMTVTIHTTD